LEILLLLSMAVFGTAFFAIDDNDAPNDGEGDPGPLPGDNPMPSDPEPTEGQALTVADGATVLGNDGDDTVTIDTDNPPEPDALGNIVLSDVIVNAAGGDDVIDLLDDETPDALQINDATLDGGEGDDAISFFSNGSVSVSGGEGNDTITGAALSGEVLGGAGDDVIEVSDFAKALLKIDGGEGNDHLIINHYPLQSDALTTAHGGEGADLFDVRMSEGDATFADDTTDVYERGFVVLPDFEPGVDTLRVEALNENDTHEVASARLEESASGETDLIILYKNDGLPDIETVIRLGATGVSWDDIEFVGDEIPELGGVTRIVTSDETLLGTEQDDIFLGAPDEDSQLFNPTVRAGAGNDVLDFNNGEPRLDDTGTAFYVTGGELHGQAGDDQIDIFSVGGTTVSGGEGDDTITGIIMGGEVYGNAGDDLIEVSDYAAPGLYVDGGNGNDTIDASGYEASVILGGAGDDEIHIRTGTYGHMADLISGGEGNDRIVLDDQPTNNAAPPVAYGGAGADVFDVRTNEGFESPPAWLNNDDVHLRRIAEFPDFEPGTDMLQVEAYTQGDSHALTSARMDEIGDTTRVVLRYESDTEAEIEVIVTLGATGISWDDIEFVGDEIPILVA